MKFRFCGDQDCPDWILTEMATLSKLSSVKTKLLAQHVARHLIGQELDLEKCNTLLADCKLPDGEFKSLLASVQYVLSSASRFSTDENHLRAELQQIGLPREHAASLAKVHSDATDAIRQRLIDQSLMVNRLEGIDWQMVEDTKVPLVEMKLHVKELPTSKVQTIALTAEPIKLQNLLYELERIQKTMSQRGLVKNDSS
nr:EOG090X0HLW [Macrothrix elegans]